MPVVIVLLLLAAAWAVYTYLQKESEPNSPDISVEETPIAVHFMENQEKVELGLQEDTRVQVLGRDENGEVISYKIIRTEADVVTNLESLNNEGNR